MSVQGPANGSADALPALEPLGDSAWLLRFGHAPDARLNTRVHACAAWLAARLASGMVECVPAFASLALHFDASRHDGVAVRAAIQRALSEWRHGVGDAVRDAAEADAVIGTREVAIPCCYGGEHGPDLEALASHTGLSADEVVRRHTATTFQVAMLGFQPGFPYLLGLEPALAMARLATPRARVPAGSVAIGGAQCGIYPRTSPGGWRLIGRTPLRLFDADAAEPCLLRPGDRVRFHAISSAELAAEVATR